MSGKVILKSFPFDNMKVLNEESGLMENDREYTAEMFRKYFSKYLSNGVYYGQYKNYGENSMKVELGNGLSIKVLKGCGLIEGADYENEIDTIFVLNRPSTGERVDRVVVEMNSSLDTRNTGLYIKEGNGTTPAELQRDDNVYEICLAEITVKSTSNLTEADIKDTRLDKKLCGIVNSLISVDGEKLYQQFQEYINSVVDALVRRDEENVVFTGTIQDVNGKTSKNNFTDAYKNKLDNISEGANKTIINNTLTSDSTEEALAAAMGKKLNTDKQNKISYGTVLPTTLATGEMFALYFE